jgi:hypothetical protein
MRDLKSLNLLADGFCDEWRVSLTPGPGESGRLSPTLRPFGAAVIPEIELENDDDETNDGDAGAGRL